MFAEKHYPDVIRPDELDAYLAEGWYRMGQTIFTTHFLCFGEVFYSAIWVRLPLRNYRFRKSLRKVIRRNDREFQTFFRKAFLDPEKERLYQKYRSSFSGLLAPSLRESLLDGEDFNLYNTYEVAVYHGNKLVAASFFDLGRNSVASIMGIYDPDYGKYSLGFFTMLMEISFAQDNNFEYYYPGYVVPGYARFDYKLRIGPVEYYNLSSRQWHPYELMENKDIPLKRMEYQLDRLQKSAKSLQTGSKKFYYPLFEVNLFGFWRTNFFDHPVFLHFGPGAGPGTHIIAVYDIREEVYQLYQCSPFDDIQFYFNDSYTNSFNHDQFFMELVVVDRTIAKNPDPDIIGKAARQVVQLSSRRSKS